MAAGILALNCGAALIQEEPRWETVLQEALAALRTEIERHDRSLKPGEVGWDAEAAGVLSGPVLYPAEHAAMHRRLEAGSPSAVRGLVLDSSGACVPGAKVRMGQLGLIEQPHRESVEPFLAAFLGMTGFYRVNKTPNFEEEPRPMLAVPVGMVTVYLDDPGDNLTIRALVMHD